MSSYTLDRRTQEVDQCFSMWITLEYLGLEIEKEKNSTKYKDVEVAVALRSLCIVSIMIPRKIICLGLIMTIDIKFNEGR